MTKRIIIGAFSYLVPTFALGFVWHLVAFKGYYEALAMYRKDVIIPFGFLSMSIQAVLFAWVYARVFSAWSDASPGPSRTPPSAPCCRGALPLSPSRPRT